MHRAQTENEMDTLTVVKKTGKLLLSLYLHGSWNVHNGEYREREQVAGHEVMYSKYYVTVNC